MHNHCLLSMTISLEISSTTAAANKHHDKDDDEDRIWMSIIQSMCLHKFIRCLSLYFLVLLSFCLIEIVFLNQHWLHHCLFPLKLILWNKVNYMQRLALTISLKPLV